MEETKIYDINELKKHKELKRTKN